MIWRRQLRVINMEIEKIAKYYIALVVIWILFVMATIIMALFLFAKFLKVI